MPVVIIGKAWTGGGVDGVEDGQIEEKKQVEVMS